MGGAKVISDLIAVRPLKGRQVQDWLGGWRLAAKDPKLPETAESVLKLLLSYR
jgi:hypothetical protein